MTVKLSSLRFSVEFDASKYVKGMNAKVAADQKGIASAESLGAALAAEDAAAGKVARGVEQMSRAWINGYGSSSKFQTGLKQINDAMDRGQISSSRASLLVEGLSRKYGQLANAAQLAQRGFVQLAPAVEIANTKLAQHAQIAAQAANENQRAARLSTSSGTGAAISAGLSPLTSQLGVAGLGLSGLSAGAATIAASVAGITAASVAIAKAGDEWTTYTNRLKAAGEGQALVNRRMSELTDIALRSRSQLAPTIDLYAGISKSTQELGKSQADVARVTETIAKAFTVGGQSAATASGAILQLNQAFAAGALRGDELNSVLEGAPPLARLIATEFGIGVGELKKFGEEGKLNADRVFDAFLKGSKEIDATFNATIMTMAQSATNAGTALTQFGAEMDSLLGISQRVAGGLVGVANAIRGVTAAAVGLRDARGLGEIQTLTANIASAERQIAELEGRRDYASRTDTVRLRQQLEQDRAAFDRLTSDRIKNMVEPAPKILLNGEGMLTTERAARTLQKGLEDLSQAEKTVARDGMESVARATAEATDRFNERAKIVAQMRKDGVENAKVADFEARSQKLLATEIKKANDAAAKKGGGGASRGAEDAFQRSVITAQGRTRAMEEEIRLVGLGGSALEAMRLQIDLETQAKRRGLEVTGAISAAIMKEVEARRLAAQALAEAKLAYDIEFERAQLGRTPGDQQIASRLRSSGLGLDSAFADAMRLNSLLSDTKGLLTDAAKGFLSDLRQGVSLSDALNRQADRLVERLMSAAVDQAIAGLFAGLGKGGGFDLLSLLGFGGGGSSSNGGWATVAQKSAKGNVFGYDNVIPFARGGAFTNRVVDRPTIFPFAKGTGLMGEAGPEAVMPLRRDSAGRLGVVAAGAGGAQFNMTVVNNTGAEVKTEKRKNDSGGFDIVTMIDNTVAGRMASPGSESNRALRTNFGAKQQLTRR